MCLTKQELPSIGICNDVLRSILKHKESQIVWYP